VSAQMIFWIVEDFVWFLAESAFRAGRFSPPGKVPWHPTLAVGASRRLLDLHADRFLGLLWWSLTTKLVPIAQIPIAPMPAAIQPKEMRMPKKTSSGLAR